MTKHNITSLKYTAVRTESVLPRCPICGRKPKITYNLDKGVYTVEISCRSFLGNVHLRTAAPVTGKKFTEVLLDACVKWSHKVKAVNGGHFTWLVDTDGLVCTSCGYTTNKLMAFYRQCSNCKSKIHHLEAVNFKNRRRLKHLKQNVVLHSVQAISKLMPT